MNEIKIKSQEKTENGWRFKVDVSGTEFDVSLDTDYWSHLTREKYDSEFLVKKAFEFLLSREPKDAILKSFNIYDINTYFPDFESKVLD